MVPNIDGSAFAFGMFLIISAVAASFYALVMLIAVLRKPAAAEGAFGAGTVVVAAFASYLLLAPRISAGAVAFFLVPIMCGVTVMLVALIRARWRGRWRVVSAGMVAIALMLVSTLAMWWRHSAFRHELLEAVVHGDAKETKALLARGIRAEDKELLQNLLVFAASDVRPDLVAMLIDADAQPNGVGHDFGDQPTTPLIAAVSADGFVGLSTLDDATLAARRLETVRLLLARGADPHLRGGFDRRAPEEIAAQWKLNDVAVLLRAAAK